MELGVLYETMGRYDEAEDAYRTAMRVEPRMTGPRSNLAALLDRSRATLQLQARSWRRTNSQTVAAPAAGSDAVAA